MQVPPKWDNVMPFVLLSALEVKNTKGDSDALGTWHLISPYMSKGQKTLWKASITIRHHYSKYVIYCV